MSDNTFTIRPAKEANLAEMQDLFIGTIQTVCTKDYNASQIQAWTSSVKNTEKWISKLNSQYFLLALLEEKIVGYASLENGNYFDLLYVHKDFQRQGIAQRLLFEIEAEAMRIGAITIDSDVSKTAKTFFERHGYVVQRENTNVIDGIEINNYRMTKQL